MKQKPKIALYWCSSCGGCEESVVDLGEDLLALLEVADIIFWPLALDYKRRDVEALDDGEIHATFINGAVRMDEQESMAKLLRRKSKLIVAHGSCAHIGGVIGLANLCDRETILKTVYNDLPTLAESAPSRPQRETVEKGRTITLSGFHKRLRTLDQVIEVDLTIPGCPPAPAMVKEAFEVVLRDERPAGRTLGDSKALCNTCPLGDTRIQHPGIVGFKRLHETEWDSHECFLNQSIICLGPVTRGGCDARCIRANMPCRGCYGPAVNVADQGTKAISFLAALIGPREPEKVREAVNTVPDPAGLFYRYSLAASLLKGKVDGERP